MRTTIQVEVGSGKTDTATFHVELEDDRIVGVTEGALADPDFSLQLSRSDFDEVVAGRLPIDEGYMQGRIKVTGNVGRMLSILPVLLSSEWARTLGEAA